MDKDRIAGAAKDAAGKVESAVGDLAGDAQTSASGRAREASGTVQNLYGRQGCGASGEPPSLPRTLTRATPRSISPRTPIQQATLGRRSRCATIRSARSWSPAGSALRWR